MEEVTGSFKQPKQPWVEQYARHLALAERTEKPWYLLKVADTNSLSNLMGRPGEAKEIKAK